MDKIIKNEDGTFTQISTTEMQIDVDQFGIQFGIL